MFIRTWILLWYMLYTVIQYKPIIYIYILGSDVTGVVGRLSKMRLSQVIHFFSSVFSPVSQVKQKLHHIYIIHYIIYICIPWATGSPGLTNESVRQAAAFAFMASDGARNAKKAWSEQRRSLTWRWMFWCKLYSEMAMAISEITGYESMGL